MCFAAQNVLTGFDACEAILFYHAVLYLVTFAGADWFIDIRLGEERTINENAVGKYGKIDAIP